MWWQEAVFYQIYPLGFCGCAHINPEAPHTQGFTQSELAADMGTVHPDAPIRKVGEWASYLQQLGISAVLFNPLFESDSHGYDTRDMLQIDQRLGSAGDFTAVCKALHERGIHVVLDAVFNHVGRGFWAFQDVREHGWDSPYRDWFITNFDGDSPYGDGFWYEGWEGHYELVKLNLQNPAVVDYLLACVRSWVECFGVDGLRLDVAYMLDRDFMRRFHMFTRELKDDFVLLGETLHGDYNQIVNDEMLDSCTNYECYKGLYSSFNSQNMFEIAHSLQRQFGADPWCIYQGKHLLSFVDNHDVNRLASILSDKNCLRPAYGVLFGMPGMPCIYYGSEWGAAGEKGASDDWDVRPSFVAPAPNELTAFIERLAAVHNGVPVGNMSQETANRAKWALSYGGYRNVVIQNKQLLFERANNDNVVYVAVNAVGEEYSFWASELSGEFIDVLSGEVLNLEGSLTIAPYEVRYLLKA